MLTLKNNVAKFINNIMTGKKIIFIKNEFQKYKNVKAYHINEGERFLNSMKARVGKKQSSAVLIVVKVLQVFIMHVLKRLNQNRKRILY